MAIKTFTKYPLEQTKLFTSALTNPGWLCAKLMPVYGYEYDWMIAYADNLKKVYRFSTNGVVATELTGKTLGWLRNTGFDWTPDGSGYANGTWIYAEYILDSYSNYATTTTLKVWRSTDLGVTWTEVFSKNGRNHATPEIYHFHLVKRDPFNAGHWYLSSGDHQEECFIWRSTDDGLTWEDVSDLTFSGEKQKIHRTTNMYFTENYIYWGLDDSISADGLGSAWVKASRNLGAGNRLIITPIANLQNWVRNLTQTPYGLIAMTEMRPTDTSNGLIWLIPYNDLEHPILIGKTPGCAYGNQFNDYSYGSRIFIDFTLRTYKLYPPAKATARFNILTIQKMDRA
jgi:hypothetical protein